MGFLLSLTAGILPMLLFAWFVYWLDRYEKEPLKLLGGVFLWGAVVAAGGAFLLNSILEIGVFLFTGSRTATDLATGSLIAPVVEETLKGIAVLIVFIFFHHEFDSILDGIIYAAIAALGFAATENIYYIFTYGYHEAGYRGLLWMTFVRVVLVGWQHPFYTAFTGIGLAIARLSRSAWIRFIAPLAGWTISVITHAFHNLLADVLSSSGGGVVFATFIDWGGWLIMLIFIVWTIHRDQQVLVNQLIDEVHSGLLTPAQYHTACSARLQSMARMKALFTGKYIDTTHFYQVCAELAHKKGQRLQLGDEQGNTILIDHLRDELTHLAASAQF